jgi:hypothetical protein
LAIQLSHTKPDIGQANQATSFVITKYLLQVASLLAAMGDVYIGQSTKIF